MPPPHAQKGKWLRVIFSKKISIPTWENYPEIMDSVCIKMETHTYILNLLLWYRGSLLVFIIYLVKKIVYNNYNVYHVYVRRLCMCVFVSVNNKYSFSELWIIIWQLHTFRALLLQDGWIDCDQILSIAFHWCIIF